MNVAAGSRQQAVGSRQSAVGSGKRFTGVFTPIVTPFTSDDVIDEKGLAGNVKRWMTTPLTGLVAGPFKLIDLPVPELYDLAADPGETG